MTEKPVDLGNIDEQQQNRDWLRIMAMRRRASRNQMARAQESCNAIGGKVSMTFLDPDDIDASWDSLQRLVRGDRTEGDE